MFINAPLMTPSSVGSTPASDLVKDVEPRSAACSALSRTEVASAAHCACVRLWSSTKPRASPMRWTSSPEASPAAVLPLTR